MTPQVLTPTDVLTLHRSDTGRSTRVTAIGELDSYTAPALAAVLEDAVAPNRDVTVDLDAVSFLGVAAVRPLAAAARRAATMDARLLVNARRSVVIQPLTVAGLQSLVETTTVTAGAPQAA